MERIGMARVRSVVLIGRRYWLAWMVGAMAPQAQALENFYVEMIKTSVIKCSSDTAQQCELSGVAIKRADHSGGVHRALVVNDKEATQKGTSTVMDIDISSAFDIRMRGGLALPGPVYPMKLEDIGLTPDGRFAIATTAFDRHDGDSPRFDGFNMLVGWDLVDGNTREFNIGMANLGVNTKASVRQHLSDALNKYFEKSVAYFKVEGLAVLPGNRLVFGIRETGQDYKHATHSTILIEAKYMERDGKLLVDDASPARVILDIGNELYKDTGADIGLSGLAYHAGQNRLYVLTSLEVERDGKLVLDAYLWGIGFDKVGAPDPASLILAKNLQNATFRFNHKAEGIAFVDDETMMIVHDDDREPLAIDGVVNARPRQMNEAVVSFLRLTKPLQVQFPKLNPQSEGRAWETGKKDKPEAAKPSGRPSI